jgi:hypothetical protein
MINPNDALLRKPVALAQRTPAILAVKKFMGEPHLKLRMLSQIADCANAQSLCFVAPHDQCVSVVEPKRLRHGNAEFSQRVSDFLKRWLMTVS